MYCNQCGHELSERENFCTVCGEAVENVPIAVSGNSPRINSGTAEIGQQGASEQGVTKSAIISSEKQKQKPTRKTVIIALLALALIAIAGVYLILTSFSQKEKAAPVLAPVPTVSESPSQEQELNTLPYEPTIQPEQVDGIVLEIRDLYNETQAGLEKYITVESGKCKAYFNCGEIVLISDFSNGATNYYYRDGKLYFIVVTEASSQSITRLYFCNDELVRFIDKDGKVYDLAITDQIFVDMCRYIDRAFTLYDGVLSYVKESRPEMLYETSGNVATDKEICKAIISSSQMKLLGQTYDQITTKFGASTGAVMDLEGPVRFSFSRTSYTFDFSGINTEYLSRGREFFDDGSCASNAYSGEEVDTYLDHDAKCCEVQNVRLGDIISVPKDGFLPDESVFGQYTNEMESCYWIQYKGYTFSVSADYDKRVYPDSTVSLYGNR